VGAQVDGITLLRKTYCRKYAWEREVKAYALLSGQGTISSRLQTKSFRAGLMGMRKESIGITPRLLSQSFENARKIGVLDLEYLPSTFHQPQTIDDIKGYIGGLLQVCFALSGFCQDNTILFHGPEVHVLLFGAQQALGVMHTSGIIHLDIKPANILAHQTRT
jgi:serine/threonine protein kinase